MCNGPFVCHDSVMRRCEAKRTGAQNKLDSMNILISLVTEITRMTITSRCNHPGPLAKLIPTRSISSLFARLLRKR
jgi:hypothetical protein